jgi:hypothetical protein
VDNAGWLKLNFVAGGRVGCGNKGILHPSATPDPRIGIGHGDADQLRSKMVLSSSVRLTKSAYDIFFFPLFQWFSTIRFTHQESNNKVFEDPNAVLYTVQY